MPESMSLKSLDPGIRRDDGKVIYQGFLSFHDRFIGVYAIISGSSDDTGPDLESHIAYHHDF